MMRAPRRLTVALHFMFACHSLQLICFKKLSLFILPFLLTVL